MVPTGEAYSGEAESDAYLQNDRCWVGGITQASLYSVPFSSELNLSLPFLRGERLLPNNVSVAHMPPPFLARKLSAKVATARRKTNQARGMRGKV